MLKPEKIKFEDFNIRGKWNKNLMTNWLKEQSEKFPNQVIQINLIDFFKEFHLGSKPIRYINYYSRKHLLECMKKLNIDGQVATSKDRLMIAFRK